jgi:cobalt-zinc-cadmium efflux system protein
VPIEKDSRVTGPSETTRDQAGHHHSDHDHSGHDQSGHDQSGHDQSGHHHSSHDHSGHGHGLHGHTHAPATFGRAFAVAIALNLLIVVGQVVFGVIGHSVALIADAGHNLSDVLGLCAAFAASRLGRQKPSPRFTYGLGGSSILAALFNAVTLLLVTGALSWEAIQRFVHPEPVAANLVMAVAGAGILVNGFSGYLLARGGKDDLNVRAAVAHLVADAAVSAGVVVGALLIALTGAMWLDPLISLFINATIIIGTWGLLRESVAMSLAGVPRAIRPEEVRRTLVELPGVAALHDLHIWSVSTSETALTAHLVMPAGHPGDAFLMRACQVLRDTYRIGHATLQVETSVDTICVLAPEEVV